MQVIVDGFRCSRHLLDFGQNLSTSHRRQGDIARRIKVDELGKSIHKDGLEWGHQADCQTCNVLHNRFRAKLICISQPLSDTIHLSGNGTHILMRDFGETLISKLLHE
jgi:hypothetical protein